MLCSPGGDVDGCIKMSAVTTAALETGALPGNCSDDDYSSREDITTQLYEVQWVGKWGWLGG